MYKSRKKQQEYMRRWRQKNPTYMREYYQEKVKMLTPPSKRRAVHQEIEV